MLVRLWARLSGLDGAGKRALPIGEFLHPLALASLVVLAVNDHLLKGSGLAPGWLTGKLSDFAGLAFFPLLITALFDAILVVPARLGLRIDFSLRRWKVIASVLATASLFSAIKLEPGAARVVAEWLSVTGWKATIVADPTDLIALPALIIPVWIAAAERRRVPLGRLEVIERLGLTTPDALHHALRDVGDPAAIEALATAIINYQATSDPELLDNTLEMIRFGRE